MRKKVGATCRAMFEKVMVGVIFDKYKLKIIHVQVHDNRHWPGNKGS